MDKTIYVLLAHHYSEPWPEDELDMWFSMHYKKEQALENGQYLFDCGDYDWFQVIEFNGKVIHDSTLYRNVTPLLI